MISYSIFPLTHKMYAIYICQESGNCGKRTEILPLIPCSCCTNSLQQRNTPVEAQSAIKMQNYYVTVFLIYFVHKLPTCSMTFLFRSFVFI